MGDLFLSAFWEIPETEYKKFLDKSIFNGYFEASGGQGDSTWFITPHIEENKYRLWEMKYKSTKYVYVIFVFNEDNINSSIDLVSKFIKEHGVNDDIVKTTNDNLIYILQTNTFLNFDLFEENFTVSIINIQME